MVRSSMDIGDSMFARPEKPASDPCVRVFAELALKEIRLGGSDLCLLSDKEAFSEFMDKVNESVLLGHREPPSAASAIGDDDKTSSSSSSSSASSSEEEEEEEEEGEEEPSSFQSVIGRSTAPPGFDAKNNKNNSDPFTNATVFSRSSVPRRVHHRDRRASGSLASPSLAPGGKSRVRFDVHGEKGYAREKTQGKIPGKVQKKAQEKVHGNVQRRKHGDPAGGREGLDGGGEANKGPLISDLGGENLLQELRRWRSRALIEMKKARTPSFPRPPTSPPPPPTSLQPTPPPPPLPSSPHRVHRSSPDRLSSAAVRVNRGAVATTAERTAAQRSYEEGVFFSGGCETRTLAELAKGVGSSGKGWGGEGGDCGSSAEATLTATAISEVLGGHHDQTHNEAEEVQPPPPLLPPSNLQPRIMAASSGRGGGVVSSGGGMVGGRDRGAGGDDVSSGGGRVDRRKGGGGLAGRRRVEEEATELSLDLSDCSDEKLGHLLERGPRRGSSLSESQGGRQGGGGRGGGHGAHGAVYAC